MKSSERNAQKKEFGFLVKQTVNKWTSRGEIEKSINNFFGEMKNVISRRCHIKKASIQTYIHYFVRRKELQGLCFVPKATNEDTIDSLYYQGKAIWRSQLTGPFDFSFFTIDKPDAGTTMTI